MGDIADDHYNQMVERSIGAWGIRRPKATKPTCTHCGCKTVHWRLFDGAYKLADDARQHPGNRYVPHLCQTTADGLGDCDA